MVQIRDVEADEELLHEKQVKPSSFTSSLRGIKEYLRSRPLPRTVAIQALATALILLLLLVVLASRGPLRAALRLAGWDDGVAAVMENDGFRVGETAVNLLEPNKSFRHHPVMQLVPQELLPFEADYLTEVNGLQLPLRFDCENFGTSTWGGYSYFKSNPSRWYACWQHLAGLKSGMPAMIPPLPLIDEEYFEHVAVYDSVQRSENSFVFAELGARWGTWGSRAVMFLKHIKKRNMIPYHVMFVESMSVHCEGLREVMLKNNINYLLTCGYATPDVFLQWAKEYTHIDAIDLDIQKAEADFFADDAVMAVVNEKVRRLIIGTHSEEIHEDMREKFSDWVLVHDMPFTKNYTCIVQFLRSPPLPDRSNFQSLVDYNCYTNTAYGKIPNADGELILDNPRFHDGHVLFPANSS